MLGYLIFVDQDGAPIDPEIIRRFDREVPPELPFVAEERVTWCNRDRSCVFLGWQAFTDFAGIGSHWAIDGDGLTAFSGHLWPQETGWTNSGQSWAAQLRRYLGKRHPMAIRDQLFGLYSILSLPFEGRGAITTDFLSGDQLFTAVEGNLFVISNRAGLAARAITPPGQEPQRSLLGAGWLPCYGSILDEESGFWSVEHVPFGGYVEIHPDAGATLVADHPSPLAPPDPTSFPTEYEDIRNAVEHDLRVTMRVIADLPISDLEFRLSGGIDSRLLTAILISEGLTNRFSFMTFGAPDRADPVVAGMVASRYGLDWRLDDRSARPVDVEIEQVMTHTSLIEGMTSGWDATSSTVFSNGAAISGVAGEYMRWGPLSMQAVHVQRMEQLIGLLWENCGFDPGRILTAEARAYYFQFLERWAEDHFRRGDELARIGPYFLHEGRARARIGPSRSINARLWLNPYLTPTIARANQRLSADRRPDPRFQIDIMRNCDVALSKIPFAESGWPSASYAHLPDADDYRAIAPIQSSDAAQNWRVIRYEDYRPVLASYLLDRANPLQEILNWRQLEARVHDGGMTGSRARLLWGVLTAAVWLGRHERAAQIAREPA